MRENPSAIVLCGGSGLRLKSITGDSPKPMANVVKHPFLELLLQQLKRSGFDHVILAVGYGENAIRSYFGNQFMGIDLEYSSETVPLGTGGALRNALGLVRSDIIIVMNGDSYTDVDLVQVVAQHRSTQADVSVVVVGSDGRNDCGSVIVRDQRVTAFEEKRVNAGTQYINAGVYVISRGLLSYVPPRTPISLERELFPSWLAAGRTIRAFSHLGICVDIGTPERYRAAQDLLAHLMS